MATAMRRLSREERRKRWFKILELGLKRIDGGLSPEELQSELDKMFNPEPELPLGIATQRTDH